MFAYCNNNPMCKSDPSGALPQENLVSNQIVTLDGDARYGSIYFPPPSFWPEKEDLPEAIDVLAFMAGTAIGVADLLVKKGIIVISPPVGVALEIVEAVIWIWELGRILE